MNESLDVKIARIEESTHHTREAVSRIEASLPHLAKQGQDNALEIALLKRDSKWRAAIVIAVGGVFGSVAGLIAEMIRR